MDSWGRRFRTFPNNSPFHWNHTDRDTTNWFMKGVCLSPSHRPKCDYCSASWVEVPEDLAWVGLLNELLF